MKRLQLTLLALVIIASSVSAQTKDSTKKATPQADTTQQRVYAIVLDESEYGKLIGYISSADEKPSLLAAYINFIRSRTRELPKAENTNQVQPADTKKKP